MFTTVAAGILYFVYSTKMIKQLLTGWHLVRLIYVLLGIAILWSGIMEVQWFGIILGSYFSVIGLFGIGCATGNCRIPSQHRKN